MKNEIICLARPDIIAMNAYRSARSELYQGNIWLDANENPLNDIRYNRYPEPQPKSLRKILSKTYSIDENNLLVTRGSDEGIDLLLRLFCRAGQDKIIVTPPTYGMYKVAAAIQGADVIEVPLKKNDGFMLNLDDLLKAWQPNVKLVFLCSPNNPTGNTFKKSVILSLCQSLSGKSIVVVDEAYIEFSQTESLIRYLNDYPNLIILRTLSKAYGLAGIRCGVTLANIQAIELLKKIIAPYPIPKPVIEIVCQQLDHANQKEKIEIIKAERKSLMAFLESMPFVKKVWESQANFILFEVEDANKVMNVCQKNGIVLRDRSRDYSLNNCIRVTIGTPIENKYLMEVLKNV